MTGISFRQFELFAEKLTNIIRKVTAFLSYEQTSILSSYKILLYVRE